MSKTSKLMAVVVGASMVAFATSQVLAHCGKCTEDCKKMFKMMEEAKISLGKAIDAAEVAAKGKAVAAVAVMDGGKLAFNVDAMAGDKLMKVSVDSTGKAGKTEEAKTTWSAKVAADAKAMAKGLDDAKLTLTKVIEAGEANAKGKACGALATVDGGKVSYEVYSMAGDKLMKTMVDGAGKATKSEEVKAMGETAAKPKTPGG